MKNLKIFLIVLFCTFLQSQQLDESYLDSLPDDEDDGYVSPLDEHWNDIFRDY